ncbi:MAG: quinone-dependent dihydroorotate dehydrogenase [Alphaproteobacteria bacterium]|nr:quinone-dependent dihydroorotate dehydrogenase [Alphaproteobacteria bacterium]
MLNLYQFARPLVFSMDPEQAHQVTLKALRTVPLPTCGVTRSEKLTQDLWGLRFPNPVGVAAGFDKNAEVVGPVLRMGFGFAEAGTVTPNPQDGNPRPRIFREPSSRAVINRMGFPNKGALVFRENIEKFRHALTRPEGIVGINIGMNKDQVDPAHDYCALIRSLGPLADYLVVNISSPNTPGLRDLQHKDALAALLERMRKEREVSCDADNPPPLLIKLAPDLSEEQQADIAEVLLGGNVDGIVLTNTTLERPESLPERFRSEKGGLSGAPLKDKSTAIIRSFYRLTKGKLPIIGVGGVSCAADAYEKIRAGASLVQVYSGLIYEGPAIAGAMNRGLLELMARDGLDHISQAKGLDVSGKA